MSTDLQTPTPDPIDECAQIVREAEAQRPPEPKEPGVYLAVPHYGALEPSILPGLMFATAGRRLHLNTNGASLLAHNFNRLIAHAFSMRSDGFTHFAMLHSDVEAPQGWLDTLIEEMERVRADVLSVVLPIKDPRGLSTTGIQHPETMKITRFTMREIMRLPVTFDAGIAGFPGHHLMVNTGLWVCRIDQPWVEEFPGFQIHDNIVKIDGRHCPRVLSEDWAFSGWAARHGLRVFATRKVRAVHHGKAGYANDHAWGQWETDQGDQW